MAPSVTAIATRWPPRSKAAVNAPLGLANSTDGNGNYLFGGLQGRYNDPSLMMAPIAEMTSTPAASTARA